MVNPISFLLVDDDADDAFLFKEVLTRINASVRFEWARDGQEALDRIREGILRPDLVFVDLNMPRMDGKEFLFELKNDGRLKTLPVVIYSTSIQPKDIEAIRSSGAACFIEKPSDVEEIQNILLTIITSLPHHVEDALRKLSADSNSFIVCY